MSKQPNIGQAFPLESLGSDLSRNSFNYQSILNGLIEWNSTNEDSVLIRLAIDTEPWFHDFKIPSKKSIFSINTNVSFQKGSVNAGHFSVSSLMDVSVYGGEIGNSEDISDILVVRISMKNNGNGLWDAYFSPLIHDWNSGIYIKKGNFYSYNGLIYKAKTSLHNSVISPNLDVSTFESYYKVWEYGETFPINSYVFFSGSMYVSLSNNISNLEPELDKNNFVLLAESWSPNKEYKSGAYVCVDAVMYLALTDNKGVDPQNNDSVWKKILLIKIPVVENIKSTGYFKWQPYIDITSIIFRNVFGEDTLSTTEFYVQNSIKTIGLPSIYERSTGIFSTCNMAFYPKDTTAIWSEYAPISQTNVSIGIDKRQDYSAVMVFDHANKNSCKTINFINYDGPDLDQGLCIYLLVQSELDGGVLVEPEDGFTYEFYFRIYPNIKYTTDTVTRDHIVNKAQIYVYNAPDLDSVYKNSCSTPISKFSMARMTNFHIFSENITIPDKPVVYRATFIYSKVRRNWILYDYYQFPDHVFVGPIGFIDPQNPANKDFYMGDVSHLYPNATHIGYETCAFPTYIDVFSNPDLSPYKSWDGKFFNRTI